MAAEVISAKELPVPQMKSIQTALRSALGPHTHLRAPVHPSIAGGLKVKVGSKLFETSLKTKLDKMKFDLKPT